MKYYKNYLLFVVALFCLTQCKVSKQTIVETTAIATPQIATVLNEGTIATDAMVSCAHPLASKVGIEIIKQGGNAIDAAIAVHFALAVVYPSAGNLGGGGFMVIRLKDGTTNTLDYRETAPTLADKDMYLNSDGDAIAELSQYNRLASGVPGSVAGMFEAHQKYGSLPMETLIQPAIDLAQKGFQLLPIEAKKLNENKADFIKYNEANNYLVNKEKEWKEGDLMKLPDLGNTLLRIQQKGKKGFYEGETANLIVAEMKRDNGIISLADLKQYQPVWRKPIVTNYKNDYKVISMGPPSSGGIALSQMLKMLANFSLNEMGVDNKNYIHLVAEVERRAFADRATHLGDMDYWNVPITELLEDEYLKEKMSDFLLSTASPSSSIKAGNFSVKESEETTHFSVVDAAGNAVSSTTTLNASFGSKVFVTGAGFLLNNEMDDFSAKPGAPNMYGLVGAAANAIEPGKRMLSSMTPIVVEKNDGLFMVLGSPGGSTIITTVLQVFLNVVAHKMTLKEATDQARFHHQWLPDKIYCEPEIFNGPQNAELSKMQHQLEKRESIGRVDAILVKPNGMLEGYSDSRAEGKAIGYTK